MEKILVIQSSPRQEQSTSRKVSQTFINELKNKNPKVEIKVRDLTSTPPPHLDITTINSFYTPVENRSPEAAKAVELSDTLTDELLASDTIVLVTPMWNFGLPSVVKAWIDHVSRAGKTFSYTPEGIVGLAKGKKVYVISSSGSVFSEGPYKSYDMLEPYLRTFFGFIGITDLTMIRAEGIRGPAEEELALVKTAKEIKTILSL